jgi:hypothetical protein
VGKFGALNKENRMDLSLDAKLYRGTAGSTATIEVNTVKDVSVSIKKGEAKISSRASRWALVKGALKEAELSVEFNSDATDLHLQALIEAFVGDVPIALYITPREGGEGLDADFEVMSMDDDEKLEEGVVYKFSIKPTYVSRYPSWH